MTHSLELTPKGIYKVNDDNPKITQYEQEVKIPDFSELSTLEGWVHKNQMILNVINSLIFSWEDVLILLILLYPKIKFKLLQANLHKKILKSKD